jgi:hypothetical protein
MLSSLDAVDKRSGHFADSRNARAELATFEHGPQCVNTKRKRLNSPCHVIASASQRERRRQKAAHVCSPDEIAAYGPRAATSDIHRHSPLRIGLFPMSFAGSARRPLPLTPARTTARFSVYSGRLRGGVSECLTTGKIPNPQAAECFVKSKEA